MRARRGAGWAFVGCLLWVSVSEAQPAQQIRRQEEAAREALEPTESAILQKEARLVADWGLWINHLFTDFKDDDNDASAKDLTHATFALDPRFWMRLVLRPPPEGLSDNEHSLYLRVKDKMTWREPPDANGNFDNNGPHLDYCFLTLDFHPYSFEVGRRFFNIGQGISYSDVSDGIEFLASFAQWNWTGFFSQTLPNQDNLDLSVPGGKESDRSFFGVEAKYIGIIKHGLYGYAVFQRDDGEEHPVDITQDYDYNSGYFGLGSEGTLLANVRYAAEVILETGEGFTTGANREKNIHAWAYDVSLAYDVQLPAQPTLLAEYAFGSGDSDRANVTDTLGGNAFGRDTNFLYFGYLPTGYALSPRLSNLRMFKVGLSLKPFEKIRVWNLKELTARVDFYHFEKDEPAGGIFDLDATANDKDLGDEVDFTLSWPVLSDVNMVCEYGHFFPGEAYPPATNNSTRYFSLSVSTTF